MRESAPLALNSPLRKYIKRYHRSLPGMHGNPNPNISDRASYNVNEMFADNVLNYFSLHCENDEGISKVTPDILRELALPRSISN